MTRSGKNYCFSMFQRLTTSALQVKERILLRFLYAMGLIENSKCLKTQMNQVNMLNGVILFALFIGNL